VTERARGGRERERERERRKERKGGESVYLKFRSCSEARVVRDLQRGLCGFCRREEERESRDYLSCQQRG